MNARDVRRILRMHQHGAMALGIARSLRIPVREIIDILRLHCYVHPHGRKVPK